MKYKILHQTGNAMEFGDFETLQQEIKNLPEKLQRRYALTTFIHPDVVGDVYGQADVVISRSGINTITMLLDLGRPAILIPLPYGQHNEQQTNAEMFVKSGLGIILPQETTTPSLFVEATTAMIEKLPEYVSKKEFRSGSDAPERIIEVVSLCIKTKQFKNGKSVNTSHS
jgi:UDP-N-acetylglucosamine--N-acetylmuramyl-(pentapeptide) pyrophosphoryl-undecaprenol N-acetylglucosamine transferase